MDNYIVSARKYRPATFESVVGQQSITTTLRNAIRTNHLAQAYLFCGPRGVGKTTCARIFAKTINCLNPTVEHDACNECESCTAFNEQRSFNIHELDAASNNSVDDIRSLIDQVRIPPQIGKYSVYIIDEVHMLSKDAFNALLKTLEEPPSYAIFILATTEKHKVIPTILSRCQVYDFARITVADMIHHLQYVAAKEGITVTEEALNVVAQKADGGMRDALSIFDQLVSFCGNNITYEQAIEVLNVLDTDYYFRLVDCALQNDVTQALLLFNNVLTKGFDAQNFVVGLGVHLRDVLVSKDPLTTRLLETSEAIRKRYQEQAARCSAPFLFQALDLVNQCDIQYRVAKNKRLTVELMLIKLMQLTAPREAAPVSNSPQLKPFAQSAAPASSSVAAPASRPAPQAPTTAASAAAPKPAMPSIQRPAPASVAPLQGNRPPTVSIRTNISVPGTAQTTSAQPVAASAPAAENPKRTAAFSAGEFENAWLTLPRLFPKDERMRATLMNARPVLENNTGIVVTIDNSLQEKEVMQARHILLADLADKLQNDLLTLRCVVKESQQTVGGRADNYHTLLQLNPELDTLRKELGLLPE